jgi:RNA polymerase sigma factor (sigma-70 family)
MIVAAPYEFSSPFPDVAGRSVAELVGGARDGDARCWEELVARYRSMVRGVAASYRLGEADAADVGQNTWLRAIERIGDLREPEKFGGWLATTARRECLAFLRRTSREVADGLDVEVAATTPGPEATVLSREARQVVRCAVAELPLRRRALVSALFAGPTQRYSDVSRTLDLPSGSIGPTRARTLRSLRRSLERDGLDGESVA